MISIKLNWTSMKERTPLSYVHTNENYYIYSVNDTTEYCCVIADSGTEAQEFVDNYESSAINLI